MAVVPVTSYAAPVDASVKTVVSTVVGDMHMVRYDANPITASINLSFREYPSTADTVYLVNANDPIVSAGITAARNSQRPGPILFVEPDGSLPEEMVAEIGRLRPKTIVAIGGEAAVQTSAVAQAREVAQEALRNVSGEDVQVATEVWDGHDAASTSQVIATKLYPQQSRKVYVIDGEQNDATIIPLAAIAGSVGQGPVILINEDSLDDAKATIDQLDPEYVVGIGKIKQADLDAVAGEHKKSTYAGSSMTSIALNAASTRANNDRSTSVLAPIDDPAALILATEIAHGPLIPIAPETTMDNAARTVKSANSLSGASSERFVAVGKAGPKGKVFAPRPPETLSGGLTSSDVAGKGIGNAKPVAVPEGLTPGKGEKFTYSIEIDEGLPVDAEEFSKAVSAILNDPRGWGRNFVQVADPAKADTRMVLASPNLVDELCAPLKTMGKTSCNNNGRTVINIERWAYGSTEFLQSGGSLEDYRTYVINHEMGHALGHGHEDCTSIGAPAPVMQQQILDMKGCKTNPWPNP